MLRVPIIRCWIPCVIQLTYCGTLLVFAGIAPAQDGNQNETGAAIQVLEVATQIDWQQGAVTLTSPLPPAAKEDRLRVVVTQDPHEDASLQQLPVPGISHGQLRLTGTTSQFLTSLAPGTRSLWVTGDTTRRYRIDLPAPTLKTAKSEAGDEHKGPSLNLVVAGLLPGFQMFHATQPEAISGQAEPWKSTEVPVVTAGIGYPRIAAVVTGVEPETAVISLRFEHRSDQATALHHFLTIVNPDGSRSATVRLTQQGIRLTSDVSFTRDGRSLPIDQEVTVPSVELIDVMEAKKQVTAAGMIPVLLDVNSLQEVDEAKDQIVLAQGISAGTTSRMGECLLLAVRVSGVPENQTTTIAHSATIGDPVGPLGIVETSVNPLGIIDASSNPALHVPPESNFDSPADNGTLAAGDNLPESGSTSPDSEIAGPDELVIDAHSDPAVGDLASNLVPDATVAVNPHPGVNLDPTTTPEQAVLTGILKVVLDEVLQKVQQGDSPGMLGSAIADVMKLSEQKADQSAGSDVPALQADDVLKTLTGRLRLQLTASQSQAAVDALRDYLQGRMQASGHAHGQVAADVAAWAIAWLYRRGFYDPATILQVSGNGLGKPVVVLSGKPVDPGWLKHVQVVNGSLGPVSVKPGSVGTSESQVEESEVRIQIPQGSELVKVGSRPSHVRVPGDLKDASMAQTLARLRQVGLKPTADGKLISTDRVVDTKPQAGKWVRPEESVKLIVLRRVPGLKEATAAAAKAKLAEFELIGKSAGSVRADDIVSDQRPPEGDYVARGTEVQVVFKRRVPDVVGRSISEADRLLADAGYKSQRPGGVRLLNSDVVLEQKPPAEVKGQPVYGNPDAVIQYVRVGTRMPDLVGGRLGKAKTLPEARQLLESMKLDFRLSGGDTSLATARVLQQSPKAGELIDRANAKVQFSVVVPVPSLPPRTSIRVAQERLKQHDLNDVLSTDSVLAGDVLLKHTIAPPVHTDGTEEYVSPKTKVTLEVGRPVPRLDQVEWRTGIAMLRKVGLKEQLPGGYVAGEFVHHTAPAGGELIDARQAVTLFPGEKVPDVRKQELAAAERAIRDAGLKSRVGRTTVAENDDRQGRSEVQSQSPSAGIVLKSPSTTITLDVTRYVMASVQVPQLVNARRQVAAERLSCEGAATESLDD